MTEWINARVVLHLECLTAGFVLCHQFFFAFFRIYVHTAELVHCKQCSILANACLLKDNRAFRVAYLHGKGTEQENGRKCYKCSGGTGDIDNSLDDVPKADLVRVNPNVREIQAVEREETSVRAVELFQLVVKLDIFFFLIAGVEVCLENRSLGLVTECLDEACVVQLVENLFADAHERVQVRIQEDNPDTAVVAQVAQHVDKT